MKPLTKAQIRKIAREEAEKVVTKAFNIFATGLRK